MRPIWIPARLEAAWLLALFIVAGQSLTFAGEPELKLEAHLIWGTNDKDSPDPKHKPVTEEVRKKLRELPLKWTNYFEVNHKQLSIPVASLKKEALSDKCAVEVKNLGQSKVQVSLFGKGEQVVKRTQDLPTGETLVLGGNAPNATAWFVLVKRVE